jgi:hypothetical protein
VLRDEVRGDSMRILEKKLELTEKHDCLLCGHLW